MSSELSNQQRDLRVEEADSGARLDQWLARTNPDISRSAIQRLIADGRVHVDGGVARPSLRLKPGQSVALELPAVRRSILQPEAIPLDVLHEDTELLVLNKPAGLVVHPAPGNWSGTLVNALLAHGGDWPAFGEDRPGLVHRLDKDTSGLMVVAKTDRALRSLQAQIQARTAARRYQALVWGTPAFETATVDAPIGRHPNERLRMAVLPGNDRSRPAQTELTVNERLGPCALLECRLRTGRTHQIRLHCASIGHPVVNDPLYGGRRPLPAEAARSTMARAEWAQRAAALRGQALVAYYLAFDHPGTGERLEFSIRPPAEMQRLTDWLLANSGR